MTVHWLDNFARTFARQGIYLDREQFVSMLWTAHGIKKWPGLPPVTLKYIYDGDLSIRAMPRLSILLSDENLDVLTNQLKGMKMVYHPFCL